jgi:hypothetical protein
MMGFLSPWFLAALAGLGVPIYIHLLRRHITTPRPVSSLMFFERGIQSSTRHRRLRYLVLFALRAALVLLIVLAFANPFLRRAKAGANDRLLLLVIDRSFSMRAGTRFADAKQAALNALAAKAPSQRAQVMTLGNELEVLTQPIQDVRALRSTIEGIQPGDSRGNLGEMGRGIRAMGETVHTPIELHFFSDMQKTGMPGNFAEMVLPANVSLVLHSVLKTATETNAPNWAVESVEAPAQLADPKDPKRSRVRAVIAGYGTPAASRTVSLVINGKTIATRKVDVPANGRASVEFSPLDVPYGFSRCEVRMDSADGFPGDDTSVFAVKRSDPERVLFVHQAGDSRSPLYFGAALAAADEASFVMQSVSAEQSTDIDPTKYAFVVLSDTMTLPSIFENALAQYVRGGGSVLIAAGTGAGQHARIPVLDERIQDVRDYGRSGGFESIGQIDLSHPSVEQGAESSSGDKSESGWRDLKFYFVSVVDPAHDRVVARLADGTPILTDREIGAGRVLLFMSGFENLSNDLPLHPVFVAFVDHAARYLSGGDRLGGARLVDSFIPLRAVTSKVGEPSGSVEVVDPDGHRPLSLSEARTVQALQLKRAGFYQIRFADGKEALIGVNPDRRESDLAPIPDDILKLWSGTSGPQPSHIDEKNAAVATRESAGRLSLWWYVMMLALVVVLAESVVAGYYLGTQREEA